jgi:hypothetical protein
VESGTKSKIETPTVIQTNQESKDRVTSRIATYHLSDAFPAKGVKKTLGAEPVVSGKKRIPGMPPLSPSLPSDWGYVSLKAIPKNESQPTLSLKSEYGVSPEMRSFLREYLSDEFLLTPKNRETLTAYWYLTPERIAERALQKQQGKKYSDVIRLSWTARSLFDLNYVIVPASLTSCQQRLHMPFRGLSYCAEIGWIDDEGEFISVLCSNPSDCPKNFSRDFKNSETPEVERSPSETSEIENVEDGIHGMQMA